MKRKTEGGRQVKKKEKCEREIEAKTEEIRERERERSRKTDGRITGFTSQSCLFAGKAANPFSPLLSSSQSCHPLVISQHKILRISPGHRGCSQMLLNHRRSRQTLNKCLIKPPHCRDDSRVYIRDLSSAFHTLCGYCQAHRVICCYVFTPNSFGKVWFYSSTLYTGMY